jgi:hypothetical protein
MLRGEPERIQASPSRLPSIPISLVVTMKWGRVPVLPARSSMAEVKFEFNGARSNRLMLMQPAGWVGAEGVTHHLPTTDHASLKIDES